MPIHCLNSDKAKKYKLVLFVQFVYNRDMIHYSTTEARKHFSEIINRVRFEHIIIAVGRHKKGEVLIVPKPELDEKLPVSAINAGSPSFSFLAKEPDLYSIDDLKKRYV